MIPAIVAMGRVGLVAELLGCWCRPLAKQTVL